MPTDSGGATKGKGGALEKSEREIFGRDQKGRIKMATGSNLKVEYRTSAVHGEKGQTEWRKNILDSDVFMNKTSAVEKNDADQE